MSTDGASTILASLLFQSTMVLGKNEFLYNRSVLLCVDICGPCLALVILSAGAGTSAYVQKILEICQL